jgi:hypothetical protein
VAIAFASFDEPHAWLIRGLVEYGWTDLGRGGPVPPGSFGALSLVRLTGNDGCDGFLLEVPAVVDGRPCREDGTYSFQVQVSSNAEGLVASVRCPEANYFQEFSYDRHNPLWAAGYIHQSLSEYVPGFVRWRLAGNEVSWSQRSGLPTVKGEPASRPLLEFVTERIGANRRFDLGPAEAWWTGGAPPPRKAVVPASSWSGPVATAGRGGGDPTYVSAEGKSFLAEAGPTTHIVAVAEVVLARERTAGPGLALTILSGLTLLQGFGWLLNAASVLFYYRDRVGALLFSLFFAFFLMINGFAGIFGGMQYRQARGGPLPYHAMAVAALSPVCCLFGLPISGWAMWVWMNPSVRLARNSQALPTPALNSAASPPLIEKMKAWFPTFRKK